MGTEHHGTDEHEHTEHTEHTEAHGHGATHVEHDAATSSEQDGSYVDSDVPEDGGTTTGPHDGEVDGSYTDSDIPADR
jgi:hypothetical protein